MTHNEKSGVAHFVSRDDAECLAMIRELFGYLPSNNLDDLRRRHRAILGPRASGAEHARSRRSAEAYDIKDVIHAIADDSEFFEVHEHFAKNIVSVSRGSTEHRGRRRKPTRVSCRCSRYQRIGESGAVRIASATPSNIPLITFEDVPGFFRVRSRNSAG